MRALATVSGMESAGSTAIWQMIQQLGVPVKKLHGYSSDPNRVTFATLRDMRDVITSLWRRECLGTKNDPDNYALGCLRYVQPRFEQMCAYEGNSNAVIIRYEAFVADPGVILDLVAKKLRVDLTHERRAEILDYCSLQKNKERAATMTDFTEWNKENLVHGNHISTDGKMGSWQDLAATLKPETVQLIEDGAREFLVHFGYETE